MLARVRNSITENKVFLWLRRHKKISAILLITIVLLVVIFRPKPPEPLETTTVKRGNITEVLSATGSIQAENSVNLTFLAGGKVTYVGVKEGDIVEKGTTIATIDQRSAQKTLENAMRDYAKQRNTFETTKDANQDLTPQTARDEAMRRVLENNQFDLEKAVASVELQEITKQNAILVAPISGIVTRADVTVPGVTAGATTTYTIMDPDSLLFEIDVDEADVGKVKLGQSAKITLEAYSDQLIYGTVEAIDFISHKTETGGNAFTVSVRLPVNPNFEYRIGMNGDSEITLARKSNTLVIPLAAIIEEEYVYVQKDVSTYEKRKIKTGLQSDTEVEVITGVSEGETITIQPDEADTLMTKNEKK